MGKSYGAIIHLDNNGDMRKTPLPEEVEHSLKRKIAESHYRGAEANNGVMGAWCQYMVGTYYEDGDSIFIKDIERAKYWYRKALENGETRAKYRLDSIAKHSGQY